MTEQGGAWPWSHPAHSVGSVTWTLPTADTLQLGLSRSAQLEGGRERAKDGSWVTSTVFQPEKATPRGAKDYDRGGEHNNMKASLGRRMLSPAVTLARG